MKYKKGDISLYKGYTVVFLTLGPDFANHRYNNHIMVCPRNKEVSFGYATEYGFEINSEVLTYGDKK